MHQIVWRLQRLPWFALQFLLPLVNLVLSAQNHLFHTLSRLDVIVPRSVVSKLVIYKRFARRIVVLYWARLLKQSNVLGICGDFLVHSSIATNCMRNIAFCLATKRSFAVRI